jgi:hypothetical protein
VVLQQLRARLGRWRAEAMTAKLEHPLIVLMRKATHDYAAEQELHAKALRGYAREVRSLQLVAALRAGAIALELCAQQARESSP